MSNSKYDKAYFAEKAHNRYLMLRDSKRCVMCSKRDERTLAGKTRCAECTEKQNALQRIYYRKIAAKDKKDEVV